MGSIIALITGWGVPAKLAKPLLGLAAVLLAVAAWSLFWWWHDSSVIREHDAAVNAAAQASGRAADNAMAETAREDDKRNTAEGAELGKVIANDPQSTRPVSDQRRAYLRCIKLQQSARANNQPAPACH